MRTDSEGYATYSYTRSYNGQTLTYYLHFYDEGLFYNGFWVVNDLEAGYVETEGRVFIYNSENDYCPKVKMADSDYMSRLQLLMFFFIPGHSRLLVHLGRRRLAIQHKHLFGNLLIIWSRNC